MARPAGHALKRAGGYSDRGLVPAPPAPAAHIRRRGFDFALGAKVLEAGTRIGPAQLALALECGPRFGGNDLVGCAPTER